MAHCISTKMVRVNEPGGRLSSRSSPGNRIGIEHDRVAEQDREERLPPVHARGHQARREHVGRDAVRHADPEGGVVVGRPVAAGHRAPAPGRGCRARSSRSRAVSTTSDAAVGVLDLVGGGHGRPDSTSTSARTSAGRRPVAPSCAPAFGG